MDSTAMTSELNESFEELLTLLHEEYKVKKFNDEKKWNSPKCFEDGIIKNLESLYESYKGGYLLANFAVGLTKQFDYYSLEWCGDRAKEIEKKVSQIVLLSHQIITPSPSPQVPYTDVV